MWKHICNNFSTTWPPNVLMTYYTIYLPEGDDAFSRDKIVQVIIFLTFNAPCSNWLSNNDWFLTCWHPAHLFRSTSADIQDYECRLTEKIFAHVIQDHTWGHGGIFWGRLQWLRVSFNNRCLIHVFSSKLTETPWITLQVAVYTLLILHTKHFMGD